MEQDPFAWRKLIMRDSSEYIMVDVGHLTLKGIRFIGLMKYERSLERKRDE